jgi:hypothetical protein
MFLKVLLAGGILLLALPQSTFAQSTTRLKVDVVHAGGDPVGQRIATALRDALYRSAEFMIGDSDDHIVRINIVSLDAAGAAGKEGVRSAVSVVYTMANYLPLDKSNPQTWYPIFLTSAIRLVGRERASAVASDILETLDAEMRAYRAASIQQ